MRPGGVEPVHIAANVGARRAHAVIGLEVHAFVFHAAPQAFDEHIVPPCAAPVHGELAAAGEHGLGELLGRELAALIGVDDRGPPKRAKACAIISMAWHASSEMATLCASTRRLATSTTAVR